MKTCDRRSFLKTAMGATLGFSLSGLRIPGASGGRQTKFVNEIALTASKGRVNLGSGPDFWAYTYNGQVPGPEIRVKEGTILRVALKNFLPEETSIHWHGVPVPNPMDGVPGVTQPGIRPGETFVYEFEATPSGTYLYHSHANYQLDQGLYGMLIIEPTSAGKGHDREFALMLEDWVTKDGGGPAATWRRTAMMHGRMGMMRGRGKYSEFQQEPLREPVYDSFAVNGQAYPETPPLKVKRGDRVKLRIANPSSSTIYDLSLAGHALTITHADGNPTRPFAVDVLRIGMGERYDVEFVADNPGRWLLAALDRGYGEGRLRVPVIYEGTRESAPIEPRFHPDLRFASYWDLQALTPAVDTDEPEVVTFLPQVLSGGMHSPFWTINGRMYPDGEKIRLHLGEKGQVGYFNRSMMPHPMHLHGHFFKIVNPNLPRQRWVKKDTVIVYPMQRLDIELKTDNPGKWFHHCHNLYHMMAGMANLIIVD